VADENQNTRTSFAERARSLLSNVSDDDRVKQATAATKDAAERTQEASKTFSRKVTQEDSWDQLRGDIEQLTEIARAHHALIVDLIDRVAALEAKVGGGGKA
jgi:predicted  nucleic acid-binding Zn-ribbon protein